MNKSIERPKFTMSNETLQDIENDIDYYTFSLYEAVCQYLDLPITNIQQAIISKIKKARGKKYKNELINYYDYYKGVDK